MGGRQNNKVLLAMSGGVDSSVAAVLLQRDGYEVVGCFMRLGSDDDEDPTDSKGTTAGNRAASISLKVNHQGCCSLNDAADARRVAAELGIPFYVLNFKKDFGRIKDYFVAEYNAGRTPNPCVRCNDWLKFGRLAEYAKSIDASYVATGHYARIDRANADVPARLMRGHDVRKDQSYVLFGTPRKQLDHMLLPIGNLEKREVRRIAQEANLPVYNKPDSQEICFVPDNDYFGMIQRSTPDRVRAGEVLDTEGQAIGRHAGHQRFTIGQRRGLGVALAEPAYVVAKDPVANTVTLGPRERLLADGLRANQTNWLIDPPTAAPIPCQAKTRYNSTPVPATVHATARDALEIRFAVPHEAVTPGQAVVCYFEDHLIGGGWITEPIHENADC